MRTSRAIVSAIAVLLTCGSATVALAATNHAASTASALPKTRLIVLGRSVGPVKLDETRSAVEGALGRGRSTQRGIVFYFGGRLRVDYWWHGALTKHVQGLETRSAGFHTRSGVHVGSARKALRPLHVQCSNGQCSRADGRMPDAPGTVFTLQAGRVTQIDIFYA